MVQMVRESAEIGYLANSSDFMKERGGPVCVASEQLI